MDGVCVRLTASVLRVLGDATLTDSATPGRSNPASTLDIAGWDLTRIIPIHFNIQSKVEKHTAWDVVFKQRAQVWVDSRPSLFLSLGSANPLRGPCAGDWPNSCRNSATNASNNQMFKSAHVGIVGMGDVSKVEISGNKPVELAVDFLRRREDSIESLSIEITERSTSEESEISGESADETLEQEQSESEKVERERGDIRANTSHHRVLHALSKLEQPAAGSEVEDVVRGVNESSIYPALTQLYQRMMIDRERVEDVANPYHEYEITDYGRETLEELGEPTPPEED